MALCVGRLADNGRIALEGLQRLCERICSQRALSIGEVFGLISIRIGNVREVDVKRSLCREHGIRSLQNCSELLRCPEAAVGHGVKMSEVDDGPYPREGVCYQQNVVLATQIADSAHHLDAERNDSLLCSQAFSELGKLLDHRRERGVALSPQQEARVNDKDLRPGKYREPARVVEHAGRSLVFCAPLEVAEKGSDRRVHGERDIVVSGERAERTGELLAHPEASREVNLESVETGCSHLRERYGRVVPIRYARQPNTESPHGHSLGQRRVVTSGLGATFPVHG